MGWLDKLQSGAQLKEVVIKNDPRYRAYQDSLKLYEGSQQLKGILKKYGSWNTPKELETFAKKANALRTENEKGIKGIKPISSKKIDVSYGKNSYGKRRVNREYDLNIYKKPTEPTYTEEPVAPILATPPLVPERTPSGYKVRDIYGTSDTSYQVDRLEDLRQLGPSDKRTTTPIYQNGGQYEGYTNQGFDYNGAWGGAFASGGGLKRSEDYGSKSKPYPSVSKGDFAGGDRSYPIPTRADAVDALKLAGLHGRADVRAKVFSKYPDLKKQDGGPIITDEMGQWKYPGEITRIPSNDITMEGVPYDVLGVSDTGDKKLMKPGKKYKFKGSSVTEYPQAQDGKELTKLDQLTNFTNYNKPAKGGWLDEM